MGEWGLRWASGGCVGQGCVSQRRAPPDQYSDGKFVYWLSKLKITKKTGEVSTFLTVAELSAHIANTHVRTLNGSVGQHAHDLIPVVAFIASMPTARQCPTEALDDMMKMCRAGQSVATIFTTLKVPQRIDPTQSRARPTPLWYPVVPHPCGPTPLWPKSVLTYWSRALHDDQQ